VEVEVAPSHTTMGEGGRDTERKDRNCAAAVEMALLSEKMSTRDLRHFLITQASGIGYP
jgi:hypothetical protein